MSEKKKTRDRDERGRFAPGNKVSGNTAEAEARRKRHQFGQPDANRQGDPSVAVSQREFYRWVLEIATEEELRVYVRNEDNPAMRRRLVQRATETRDLRDLFEFTNQIHGAPKQVVEMKEMPTIECKIFGAE